MEKKTAHYPLTEVKRLVDSGAVSATKSASDGAAELGFTFKEMLDVVRDLEPGDLHKSMTTHHDNSIWQDVYHYPEERADIYLKIQIVGEVVIISFKEQ